MVKYKSVKFNFIMNFILTVSNFIFPIITFPYVSRVLQASGLGRVGFATSIFTFFSLIALVGIPAYGVKACAKVRHDSYKLTKTVYELLVINFSFLCVSSIILLVCISVIDRIYVDRYIYYIFLLSLFFFVIGVEWLYRALEQYSYITVRSIIFKVIAFILIFIFVKDKDDIIPYVILTVLAAVGSDILNFYNLRKVIILRKVSIHELDIKKHMKPIFSYFFLSVSTTLYVNLDSIILGFMMDDDSVGYYSAAIKIKQILVSLVTSLGIVLLPRLTFYYEQKQFEKFNNLVEDALKFVIIVSLPLVVYFIIYAKSAIVFLSGETFSLSIEPMQIIMPTVFFIALSNLMGWQILAPMDRERQIILSMIIAAFVGFLINIILIPILGVNGSAIANLCAECTVVIIQVILLRKFLMPIFSRITVWRMLLSLFISMSLIMMIDFNSSNFIKLSLSGTLFFGSYFLCLVLLKEPSIHKIISPIFDKFRVKGKIL